MLRIVSFDPGKTNFAYGCIHMHSHSKFKIRQTGFIENTITGLTEDILAARKRFQKEIRAVVKANGGVDVLVAERFQNRGIKGNLSELVNVMLGVLITMYPNVVLVTASQWKNRLNRHVCLNDMYAYAKKEYKLQPHEIDATSIGIYEGQRQFGHKDHFSFLGKNHIRYIEAIHDASTSGR